MPYERDSRIPPDLKASTYISPDKPVGTIGDRQFDRFFRDHERVGWSLVDFADGMRAAVDRDFVAEKSKGGLYVPRPFRPELVTQEEVDTLTYSMLVESHNPVYVETLNAYPPGRMDIRDTNFNSVWGYEEWKHFQASLMYLEAVAHAGKNNPSVPRVDLEELNGRLETARAGSYGEGVNDASKVQVYGYTMLQELFTYYHYRNAAQQATDPTLKDLYQKMSRDEMRHHKWYFDRTDEHLHPDPENAEVIDPNALEDITTMLMEFSMPGSTFIPEFQQNPKYAADSGNPNSELGKLLIGKLDDLIGKKGLDNLLKRQDFRDSLEARGVSGRKLFAFRMMRRLPLGR